MTQHEWRLGKYIVGRRIGGGMTSVHLATNTETGLQVVLKLIAEADEDAPAKIHAEQRGAEIQKRLAEKDSRIPKVFEFGRMEGYFYIEMEYVDGRPLDKTGKIASGLAVTIAIEVCDVLELAHNEGIIHGDIKPGNILDVTSDSDKTQRTTVKLLDFGVSRFMTSATRNLFRSVPYCSPEVRLGSDPGRLDDLWSVCVTIYELVEGRLPFTESTRPLFTEESRCPPDLRFILQKMFGPDVRSRYQSASLLKADLQAFHNGKPLAPPPVLDAKPVPAATVASTAKDPAPKPPPPKPQRPRRPVLAVLVLSIIAVVALTVARSASTMLDFARAANSAQPDNQASIIDAANAYKRLDGYGGMPKLLMAPSSSRARLRETCLVFAGRIIAKYARELDLPEKGNVSEREWKAAIDVLTIGEQIESGPDVRAMMAYAKGHYHRINAESRIGMSADAGRKKSERAAGVDHYAQAEEYFSEALRYRPEWGDAAFGLVRLYANVFPEMDKAETVMTQAERWAGMQPLRLQFEMALGHHVRASELSRTVTGSLETLSGQNPGPVAEVDLARIRADVDALDSHIRSALTYYDMCLGRGSCWDARFRRTRVGVMIGTVELQRAALAGLEARQRLLFGVG